MLKFLKKSVAPPPKLFLIVCGVQSRILQKKEEEIEKIFCKLTDNLILAKIRKKKRITYYDNAFVDDEL